MIVIGSSTGLGTLGYVIIAVVMLVITILVIGFLAFAAFFLVGGTIATIIDTIRNFLKK